MKSSGIVRRIDELGRIVIPKEIRKTLRIKEGDYFEIISKEGDLSLRKYSLLGGIEQFAKAITESARELFNQCLIITDTDKVLALSCDKKTGLFGESISKSLMEKLEERREIIVGANSRESAFDLFAAKNPFLSFAVCPILLNGDVYGSVILANEGDNQKISYEGLNLIRLVASVLGRCI